MLGRVVVVTDGQRSTAADVAESFDSFYRNEYPAVVRLAFALVGRRDVAEELAQEGFLSAHRQWAKVSQYESPPGWVRLVVTNRCISAGRRYATELRLLARLSRERPSEPELPAASGELWAFVRDLPRRQAQVLALTFVEDRSVADIAGILGCGEETVRTHLRRGRLEVARRLGLTERDEVKGDRDG